MTKKQTYFGFSGQQLFAGLVIIGLLATFMGYGPLADEAPVSTATMVSESGEPAVVNSALQLDSAFVSVVSDSNTLADVNNGFNDDTNVASIQLDTETFESGGSTYFIMKTIDTAGNSQELLNFSESGSLTEPVTDQTIGVTVNIDESVIKGFTTTDQVHDATIYATGGSLVDNVGVRYYPIAVRSGDATLPAVYVDGDLDKKAYLWTAATATKNIDVTFDLSWTGVSKMDDLDKTTVKVTLDSGDDSPIKLDILKNKAL